ncbi:MAG: rhodanese-like domain-containing protein [Thermodesulfobacteriota bacterium]
MDVPRITPDELKGKVERGEPITVLDVRNDTDYAASGKRIPGAVRIPVGELSSRTGELDPAMDVAAYCT